jgi:hypothetical protein
VLARSIALAAGMLITEAVVGARPAEAASAISTSGPELAQALGTIPKRALVVTAPLTTDLNTSRSDELVARLAASLAAKLDEASVAPHPASLAAAHALASRHGALVYLQAEVKQGELRLTVDVFPIIRNSWERLRKPRPAPIAHQFWARALDAELRSYFAPIPLESFKVRKMRHDEGEVLAIACGDIDGDGGLEVALLSTSRVTWGRFRAGAYVVERAAAWRTLHRRAPAPLREPLATLAFAPGGDGRTHLFGGSTDRGGVRIAPDLQATSLKGLPFAVGSRVYCSHISGEAFDGNLGPCGPEGTDVKWLAPAARFDALSAIEVARADGQSAEWTAVREPSGKLRIKSGAQVQVLEGIGAQFVLADLDLDGVPELASSADVTAQQDDLLTVSSIAATGFRQRLRLPVPSGVRAVAACPPEVGGQPSLVVATGPVEARPGRAAEPAEVWLVR